MKSLNDMLKKKTMSRNIKGKGTTLLQVSKKKKQCASCIQK